MSDQVLINDDDGVRVIRMNRPEKKNALTQPMYAAMTRALDEAGTDPAIRCVVIAGAPGAFSAGSDIADFLKAAEGGLKPITIDFLKALSRNRKPLVAAVNGLAAASAPPCCCIATSSSPRPARHSRRRSPGSGLSPKRRQACWRRYAWDMRALSP